MLNPITLVKAIPTPYMLLGIAALVAAAAAAGYVKGASHVQDKWDLATAKENSALAQRREKQAEAIVKVVTQYVDRVKVVREAAQTIIKEIPVYVTPEADAACTLTRGFVRLHDAAAAGRVPEAPGLADASAAGIALSTAAATITDNYGRCHENAEQLKALQDFVNAQQ